MIKTLTELEIEGNFLNLIKGICEKPQFISHVHARSHQSCPTLFNPVNCSLPGSSVCGILQAGILKWVAMPSSTESKYLLACDTLKFCFLELSHFSCSVVSNSLQPHVPQHARLPCLSPPSGACANSCPASWWCHPTISSSAVPFSSCLQSFHNQDLFQRVSTSHQVANYWRFSFSISPSNEYSGLISFRIDWLDLLAVQGTLKGLLHHCSSKASILLHSASL